MNDQTNAEGNVTKEEMMWWGVGIAYLTSSLAWMAATGSVGFALVLAVASTGVVVAAIALVYWAGYVLWKMDSWMKRFCFLLPILAMMAYYYFVVGDPGFNTWMYSIDHCGEKTRCYDGDVIFGRLLAGLFFYVFPLLFGLSVAFCIAQGAGVHPTDTKVEGS